MPVRADNHADAEIKCPNNNPPHPTMIYITAWLKSGCEENHIKDRIIKIEERI